MDKLDYELIRSDKDIEQLRAAVYKLEKSFKETAKEIKMLDGELER